MAVCFSKPLVVVYSNMCFILSVVSGQGGLLLKYWRWIGSMKDSIPEQYKIELRAVEEQGIQMTIVHVHYCHFSVYFISW